MIEIRDQKQITSLTNAWRNCGVLSTATTGSIDCLPISDVRNVETIDFAFAVDDVFQGKNSYIDNVGSMETVDPGVVTNAVSTFQNNQFKGTSTGAPGSGGRTDLKNMFANNLDLTVDGIPSDEINGKDIFEKLSNIVFNTPSTANNYEIHNHVRYFPYLDGHTTCFSKNQGTTTIGKGNVAAINTSAITNEFSIGTITGGGLLLQTEVAFSVTNDGNTETILSKTKNDKKEPTVATGDTQSVGVSGSGDLTGGQSNSVSTGAYTLSWDGIPCTKKDITYESLSGNPLELPNNMNFKICHQVTINSGTKFNAKPGTSIRIETGGSLVIESGATANIEGTLTITGSGTITNNGKINNEEDATIKNNGTITNNGTIDNDGTIETVTSGITGNSVQGNTPVTI